MKKYLLLLVFAISTSTCFALPPRPVASVQERSDELPSDETIADFFSILQQIWSSYQDFYYIREDMIETSGDHYIRVAFADEIENLDILAAEAKEILERYCPDGKYIGGITTLDEIHRIDSVFKTLDDLTVSLRFTIENHIDMYQELFVPFKTSYNESLNAFKECEAILRDHFYNYTGYVGMGIFHGKGSAVKVLNSTFVTLFSDIEQAMCDGISFSELIDEFNERLAEANSCVERLNNIGDVTYREKNAFNDAHDTLESECPDVFEYYIKELWRIDDEFKDAFYANGSMNDIIYNQEHTDIYITTVEKLIEDIANVVTLAKEAQKRYEECMAALEDAKKALDDAWAAVMSECPDVYNNYQSVFDDYRNELDSIEKYDLSDVAQNRLSEESFMQLLRDFLNRVYYTVDEAQTEQNGTTGVAGVEAAGNDAAEYYDLNGAKVTNPRPGTIVIKVDANGKTTKVVVR